MLDVFVSRSICPHVQGVSRCGSCWFGRVLRVFHEGNEVCLLPSSRVLEVLFAVREVLERRVATDFVLAADVLVLGAV